jgi:hypothetical protein
LLNVGDRSVARAREVITAELQHEVEAGHVSVTAAADVASRPETEQDELVARGKSAIRQAAREIRAKRKPKRRQSKSQESREQRAQAALRAEEIRREEELRHEDLKEWVAALSIDSASDLYTRLEEHGPYAVMEELKAKIAGAAR